MLLVFENGTKKKIDLRPYLHGAIFKPISDNRKMFEDVHIEGGTVAWSNGADIDPDVLYYDLNPFIIFVLEDVKSVNIVKCSVNKGVGGKT